MDTLATIRCHDNETSNFSGVVCKDGLIIASRDEDAGAPQFPCNTSDIS